MINSQNEYKTRDIGLAATLICSNKKLIEISKIGNICWFYFENLDDCLVIDKEYWFGSVMVDARKFKQNLNQLKTLIHQ